MSTACCAWIQVALFLRSALALFPSCTFTRPRRWMCDLSANARVSRLCEFELEFGALPSVFWSHHLASQRWQKWHSELLEFFRNLLISCRSYILFTNHSGKYSRKFPKSKSDKINIVWSNYYQLMWRLIHLWELYQWLLFTSLSLRIRLAKLHFFWKKQIGEFVLSVNKAKGQIEDLPCF